MASMGMKKMSSRIMGTSMFWQHRQRSKKLCNPSGDLRPKQPWNEVDYIFSRNSKRMK